MLTARVTHQRLQRSVRVTLIGMVVNTVLAGVKMVAGVVGHSHALIADGVESLADIISSLVVWRGVTIAAQPADEDHPYGHGKAEALSAAVVSTMLLLAALWIAVHGVREILRPHSLPAGFTLIVLVLVILIKECLFRFVSKEGMDLQSSAVATDAWHHRSDAITSLFAGVGILVSIVGGPGYEAADDVAAVIASGIIALNGYKLLKSAMNELMDAAPNAELTTRVRSAAAGVTDVHLVEKCLIRKIGPAHYVDMHIEVDPGLTVEDAHRIAHSVKDAVRTSNPEVWDVLVHVEPAGNSDRLKDSKTSFQRESGSV